jgi:rhodanese-related sulfurtransferase
MGLSVPQYLLYNGLGTFLWAGSGIGLGYAFSDQLEQASALGAHIGPAVGLIVLSGVIGYVGYKAFHRYRMERLVPRLTARQLRDKLAMGEDPMIIDLRPQATRQEEGGIPGSVPLALEELIARQHDLPRDRDVILYCACPKDAASVQGTLLLRKQGFTRVWPLAGGIEAWRAIAVKTEDAVTVSNGDTVTA